MSDLRKTVSKRGAQVGAAAFAVGLSLAGPQALGMASADTNGTDSPTVTSGSTPSASTGRAASRSLPAGKRGARATGVSGAAAPVGARNDSPRPDASTPPRKSLAGYLSGGSDNQSNPTADTSSADDAISSVTTKLPPAAAVAPLPSWLAGVQASAGQASTAKVAASTKTAIGFLRHVGLKTGLGSAGMQALSAAPSSAAPVAFWLLQPLWQLYLHHHF